MGVRDFAPVFCDECEAAISLMMDQNGEVVLACACLEGRRDLGDDTRDWVADRGTRMDTT